MGHILVSTRTSLPLPLDSFVGRDRELAEVKRLLASHRLITLAGPAGIGKTRLALQVADQIDGVEDGVFMVTLDAVQDPDLVPGTIAKVLGIQAVDPETLWNTILERLCDRRVLLLIDNFEQVIQAATRVSSLLTSCSGIKIIVTSREPLHLHGEQVFRLAPLVVPDGDDIPPADELPQYSAVALFVDRAQAARRGFALTDQNARVVVELCKRLDGIPWPIELAAAQVRALSVSQILARLQTRFDFLTESRRPALQHHLSLGTTVSWSVDLLTESEKALFMRLAVFDHPFTAADVAATAAEDDDSLDATLENLARLVDKSLVEALEVGGEMLYWVLQIHRQYAQQKRPALEIGTPHPNHVPNGMARTPKPDEPDREREADLTGTLSTPDSIPSVYVPALRVYALGPIRAFRSDHLIGSSEWTYAKSRELLLHLLCYPARTREQIGVALWPNASPEQLRDSFRVTLFHLRRVLGHADWVIYDGKRYSFNRAMDYWFDVEAFESLVVKAAQGTGDAGRFAPVESTMQQLQEAVKLVQGEFLAGMPADWALHRREELRRKHLSALIDLGQMYFAVQKYDEAADCFRQVIALDEYFEVAHRQLMRCYARQGERSQALRHYHNLVVLLQNELGVPPAAQTTEIYPRLRQGEDI